ncbi:MAG: sensor histidine kinase [Myxococcaceae bacterium]
MNARGGGIPLALVLGAVGLAVLGHAGASWGWSLQGPVLHAMLEGLGALAALGAGLVLLQRNPGSVSPALPAAAGLLAMGTFRGLHAVALPGEGYLHLEAAGTLAGALGFCLGWLPAGLLRSQALWKRWAPALALCGSLPLGLYLLRLTNGEGPARPMATGAGYLAAALYAVSLPRLLGWYRKERAREALVLAFLAVLHGLAGFTRQSGLAPDGLCWAWHGASLAGFAAIFWVADSEWRGLVQGLRNALAERGRVQSQLLDVNAQLEERVRERTCALEADIAHRRLAEAERDRLLVLERATHARAEKARADAEAAMARLRSLQSITEAALTSLELDDLLADVVEGLSQAFKVDTVGVSLLTEDGLELEERAGLGESGKGVPPRRLAADRGVAGFTLGARNACIIDDLSQAELPLPSLREAGIVALMTVPLRLEGRAIGMMHVGTRAARRFSEEDATLLQLIADRVAIAVDRSRLYEAEWQASWKAQRAIYSRDELLATLSHDLKSPLSAISLSAAHMNRLICAGEQVRAAGAARAISRTAAQVSRLLGDLLDAAHIDAGGFTIRPARYEVGPVVEEAIELLLPLADEKSLRIERQLEAGAPAVLCDRLRVLQVLSNLLGNAIKFTPAGGVLTVKVQGGPQARFSIEDSGPGIPEAALPHLFERFWHGDSNRAGTGLGLYIAKTIVEAHGGRIWTERREGAGAIFCFTLPWAQVQPAEALA